MNFLLPFLVENTNINFPNLGICLKGVGEKISIGSLDIAYYGIVIGIGMLVGYLVSEWTAKRTGQNPDIYLDFAIWAIIISVICARLYYVIFNWRVFSDDLLSIFNLRTGGLAIYGGVIGGILTAYVYSRIHKIRWGKFFDTAIVGLLTGQIIGRWGNFFNREAFGTYTDSLFAMQVDVRSVSSYFNPNTSAKLVENAYVGKPDALANIMEIRNNAVVIDGATYIQVHPTFLYESVWNLVLLVFLLVYTKHKKFDGEIFLWYLFGYGAGRLWIEGLRTDQLFLFNTPIAVSQLLSLILIVLSMGMYIFLWKRNKKTKQAKA